MHPSAGSTPPTTFTNLPPGYNSRQCGRAKEHRPLLDLGHKTCSPMKRTEKTCECAGVADLPGTWKQFDLVRWTRRKAAQPPIFHWPFKETPEEGRGDAPYPLRCAAFGSPRSCRVSVPPGSRKDPKTEGPGPEQCSFTITSNTLFIPPPSSSLSHLFQPQKYAPPYPPEPQDACSDRGVQRAVEAHQVHQGPPRRDRGARGARGAGGVRARSVRACFGVLKGKAVTLHRGAIQGIGVPIIRRHLE